MLNSWNIISWCTHAFFSSQSTGEENQVSSTTTSGFKGFPVTRTEAMEDVITTLLIDGTFAQDWRTLSVPFTAGSMRSAWNWLKGIRIITLQREHGCQMFICNQRE